MEFLTFIPPYPSCEKSESGQRHSLDKPTIAFPEVFLLFPLLSILHLVLSRFVQPKIVQTFFLPDTELTLGVISFPPVLGQITFLKPHFLRDCSRPHCQRNNSYTKSFQFPSFNFFCSMFYVPCSMISAPDHIPHHSTDDNGQFF